MVIKLEIGCILRDVKLENIEIKMDKMEVSNEKIKELTELIFERFRKQKFEPSQSLPWSIIKFNVFDKLNPKERIIFHGILHYLRDIGYYELEIDPRLNDPLKYLKLTEKGYDYIYNDDESKYDVLLKELENLINELPENNDMD